MTSSRTFERWTTIAALFVLIGQILLLGGAARAAVGPETLLQSTPLVLKDGRIANVSIHLLPFDTGQGRLAGDVAARLAELTATAATDCFLTAQVIGHVSSREVAENETLEAHRLARSRADAVQASLIGGGLPAKAIASVWDWQFLVREPRATLWMFRLVEGEDCDGLPLDGDASQLVAGNDAEADQAQAVPAQAGPAETRPAPEVAEAPRPASPAPQAEASSSASPPAEPPAADLAGVPAGDLAGVVASAAAAEAAPQPETTAAKRPVDQPEETAKPAGPARDAVPTLTRPLPALSPAQDSDDHANATAMAAAEPTRATAGEASQRAGAGAAATRQTSRQQDPERKGKVERGQDGDVVITFATNSSYFPSGTSRRLRALLADMASGERYRVQLEAGVSGSDTVVGAKTPEEARRYNRWLAERRLNRVREWLDENANDRELEIEPTFHADDNSRRVVVRVAPVS